MNILGHIFYYASGSKDIYINIYIFGFLLYILPKLLPGRLHSFVCRQHWVTSPSPFHLVLIGVIMKTPKMWLTQWVNFFFHSISSVTNWSDYVFICLWTTDIFLFLLIAAHFLCPVFYTFRVVFYAGTSSNSAFERA